MSSLAFLLAAEGAAHPSKTAFYIGGGALVAWALIVALIGMTRPDFPAKTGVARLTMLVSLLLVLGAMSTTVLTS